MTWDSFSAFAGNIDASFVSPRLDTQNRIDRAATDLWIYSWLHGLRTSPKAFGVAPNDELDVVRLLDVFFPAAAGVARVEPQRISIQKLSRELAPFEVNFQQRKPRIVINDAPNALAYIFLIAVPPDPSPNYGSYYLPLAVCYCWALYCLLLWPTQQIDTSIGNVPAAGCLLYIPGESPRFGLGSTWSEANPADPYGAGFLEGAEAEHDRWRLSKMIDPLIKSNSSYPMPFFNPTLRRIVARRLNEYILGQADFKEEKTPFLAPFSPVLVCLEELVWMNISPPLVCL